MLFKQNQDLATCLNFTAKEVMDKQKRDLFQPQTSGNSNYYNQDKLARSSGDNDDDRIIDTDKSASEKTDEAYFSTLSKKPGANGLDQQDKSLKNSK